MFFYVNISNSSHGELICVHDPISAQEIWWFCIEFFSDTLSRLYLFISLDYSFLVSFNIYHVK